MTVQVGSIVRSLSQVIRARRETLGLTQETVAYEAGLSSRHLQKIERGIVDLKIQTLADIAPVLKTTPADLLADAQRSQGKPRRGAAR